MNVKDKIQSLSSQYLDEIIAIRRHLHAQPELSFEEYETAKFVASKLKEFGIEFQEGVADTGVIGLIEGTASRLNRDERATSGGKKKTIALRADLDALPITEQNEVEYKSKNEGIMHACGHDVHTSSLLGAAKILNEIKNEFEGTVKLIFQPGEEKNPGGASLMIKDGVLENPKPDRIFGQHVFPELDAGKVGFCSGEYMASADEIYLTVKGRGGHAALPHNLVDPVLIAAHIIVALQQVVSRNAHPFVPCVLSFGKVIANGATNIIPDKVEVVGTFRTMNEEWREQAHQKITQIAEKMAESMGGSCEVLIDKGYPVLKNDGLATAKARHCAEEFLGKQNVVDLEPRMGAEDFAYYSQQIPACFYRLGTRNESKGITSNIHTSTFDIDENALQIGAGLMAWIAVSELSE